MEKKLNKALDSIDIKILNELQRNGKISNIDLSKKVWVVANALFRKGKTPRETRCDYGLSCIIKS